MRSLAVTFVVSALTLACGSDSPTAPTSIAVAPAPTPLPTPAPTPAPTLAQIGGEWNGSLELQIDGVRRFGTVALRLEQNDRSVRGTWRVTGGQTPGTNPWRGDINGTLTLAENGVTRFSGTATIVAEISSGTGACHGSVVMEGASSAQSMRWEGPNPTFTDCRNNTGGYIWTMTR
jgi:hypothetical protein